MVANAVQAGEVERLMREGQAAAKRGDKVVARTLLTQLLERDPHNEKAWMWLSGAVGDSAEQQTCLENVLIINPSNEHARRGLQLLSAKTGILSPVLANLSPSQVESAGPSEAPAAALGESWGAVSHELTSPLDSLREAEALELPEPGSGVLPPWEQPFDSETVPPPAFDLAWSGSDALSPNLTSIGFDPEELTAPPAPVFEAEVVSAQDQPSTDDLAAEAPLLAAEDPGTDEAFEALQVYAGGPPSPGLPTDVESAIPDWVRGSSATASGEPDELPDIAPFSPFEVENDPQPAQLATATPPSGGLLSADDAAAVSDGIDAWLDQLARQVPQPGDEVTAEGAEPVALGPAAASATANSAEQSLDPTVAQSKPPEAHQTVSSSDPNVPTAFGANGPFAGMGPFDALPLPPPDQLPGGPSDNAARPWYLRSGDDHISAPPSADAAQVPAVDAPPAPASGVAMVACPNCREQVAETALACPSCRFNFFVHCPHCHELVDASDARRGVTDSCPYCSHELCRYDLGLMYARDDATLTVAEPVESAEKWVGASVAADTGFHFSFAWLVDVLWLLAIALMIWALTQLPGWFHLTGLYS